MRALIIPPVDLARSDEPAASTLPDNRLLGGRLILEYQVAWLRHQGASDVTVYVSEPQAVACGLPSELEDVRVVSWADLVDPFGHQQLAELTDDSLLIMHADVLTDLDLTAVLATHRARTASATVVAYDHDGSAPYGILGITREGRVEGCTPVGDDARGGALASAGIYVVDRSALRALEPTRFGPGDCHIVRHLLDRHQVVHGHPVTSLVRTVGSAEDYQRAEEDYRRGYLRLSLGAHPCRWYVARSKPRAERFAAAAFEARGLIAYLPEWQGRGRQRTDSPREPLFPSYLFFRTDGAEDALVRARSVPNVSRLLGGGTGPEPVPDEIVDAIRRRCEVQHREPFVKGQQVRIGQGPFRELDALFEEECSGGKRARVFVQMLRRLVPVIVDVDALRRAV